MSPRTNVSVIPLEERLSFETLLADLSSSFVNVSPEDLDAEIGDALRRVCEHLGLDVGVLWQWCEANPSVLALTNLFRRYEGPPVPPDIDARESFPWALAEVLEGRIVRLARLEDAPPEARVDLEVWRHFELESVLVLPLVAGGGPIAGVLSFHTMRGEKEWPDPVMQRLQLVAQVFANALERKRADEELRRSYAEVKRLKSQLEQENLYLKQEHQLLYGSGRVVGESPAILQVLALVEQVAPTASTVLVEGETGTGKELIARRIHELSPRCGRPMVTVNCAALPSTLVESELFGREKGAYTGAVSREAGRFEVANGSTIFLDEVAELPLELQAKLLRVLEEGQFERVGSSRTMKTDVRVIAATNRDLQVEVEAGRFRRDLYFRLAVFPIRVPPLRARRQDIPLLVWSAVEEFSRAMAKSIETIRREDMEGLQRYDWPGNVRELRNLVERAMILSSGPLLRLDVPGAPAATGDAILSLDEAQRRQIAKALEVSGGRIRGPGGAAELLGMKPTTLRSRMQRLGLDPRRARDDRPLS
jgi:formate hydrogenlyase transcriptional activator